MPSRRSQPEAVLHETETQLSIGPDSLVLLQHISHRQQSPHALPAVWSHDQERQPSQHVSDAQGLPWMHKVCLWLGIAMDVGAKAGLCMQLRRFALHAHWAWLAVVAAFFALSSLTSLGWVAACSPPASAVSF